MPAPVHRVIRNVDAAGLGDDSTAAAKATTKTNAGPGMNSGSLGDAFDDLLDLLSSPGGDNSKPPTRVASTTAVRRAPKRGFDEPVLIAKPVVDADAVTFDRGGDRSASAVGRAAGVAPHSFGTPVADGLAKSLAERVPRVSSLHAPKPEAGHWAMPSAFAYLFNRGYEPLPFVVHEQGREAGHAFRRVRADARVYAIDYDGHRVELFVPVYTPDGLVQHDPNRIARALSMLPRELLLFVKSVTLNPVPEALSGGEAVQSTDGRGNIFVYPYAWGNPPPAGELEAALYHECGHSWSIPWPSREWEQWRVAMESDRRDVSRYGATSMHEDFAEATAAYHLSALAGVQDAYRRAFPARFAFLDRCFARA